MGITVVKVAIIVGLLAASLAFAFWMEHLQQRETPAHRPDDARRTDDRTEGRRLRKAS